MSGNVVVPWVIPEYCTIDERGNCNTLGVNDFSLVVPSMTPLSLLPLQTDRQREKEGRRKGGSMGGNYSDLSGW